MVTYCEHPLGILPGYHKNGTYFSGHFYVFSHLYIFRGVAQLVVRLAGGELQGDLLLKTMFSKMKSRGRGT